MPRAGRTDHPITPTALAGDIEIDYRRSTLTITPPGAEPRSFPFPPLSPVAQELVIAGGAEEVVRRRLATP